MSSAILLAKRSLRPISLEELNCGDTSRKDTEQAEQERVSKPIGCSVTRSNSSTSTSPLFSVYFNTLTTSKTSCASNPNYLIGTASVESVPSLLQTCFIVIVAFSFILKHPNISFF